MSANPNATAPVLRQNVRYSPKEPLTLTAVPGFAGFVVLLPGGATDKGMILVRAMYVDTLISEITFTPRNLGLQIVDVPEGYALSALEDFLNKLPPDQRPGGPIIVKGRP